MIKNFNLLMSKLKEKPSALKREHPALQKLNFINFFLCLWDTIVLLDPDTDPGSPFNPDPIRIHSTAFEDCIRPARAGQARCRSADRCPDRRAFPSCSPAACSHPPDYTRHNFSDFRCNNWMQVEEVLGDNLGNQSISFRKKSTCRRFSVRHQIITDF